MEKIKAVASTGPIEVVLESILSSHPELVYILIADSGTQMEMASLLRTHHFWQKNGFDELQPSIDMLYSSLTFAGDSFSSPIFGEYLLSVTKHCDLYDLLLVTRGYRPDVERIADTIIFEAANLLNAVIRSRAMIDEEVAKCALNTLEYEQQQQQQLQQIA